MLVLINHKYKFIFIIHGKCGSSSIKQFFCRLSCIDGDKTFGKFINKNNIHYLEYDQKYSLHFTSSINFVRIKLLQKESKYTIYNFIRNPYERIVSCYIDKFVNRKRQTSYFYQIFSKITGVYDFKQITFETFVDLICQNKEAPFDGHILPCSQIGNITVDYAIDVNSLNSFMTNYAKKVGFKWSFDIDTGRNSCSPKNKKKVEIKEAYKLLPYELVQYDCPNYSSFYNNNIREKVKSYYLQDINNYLYKYFEM